MSTAAAQTLKNIQVRRINKEKRYQKIREMFNDLYNQKRLRFDDVLAQVAEHFGLAESTIRTALKS